MATLMDPQAESQFLVKKAQGGDRAAFGELAERYRPRIEALVRARLRAPLDQEGDVEDVLQETFLRAFQFLARFEWRSDDSFFRWLSGIAVNVLLEAASRHGRDPSVFLEHEVPAEGISPSKAFRRKERFDRLEEALKALSPDHREVLFLVRIEGRSIQEVARRMQRSPHAVSNLLLRAARKLRETFGDTESLGLPARRLRRPSGLQDGRAEREASDDRA